VSRSVDFKVTWRIGSAVSWNGDPLHLDALLAAMNKGVHGLSMLDDIAMGSAIKFHEDARFSESLKGKLSVSKPWVRQSPYSETFDEFLRKDGILQSPQRLGRMPESPNSSAGRRKNYGGTSDTRHSLRRYDTATAYGVADDDNAFASIQEVLKRIRFIGGLGRIGCGRVIDMKVEQVDCAPWAKRVLPARLVDKLDNINLAEYAPVHMAIKAPYWCSENKEDALLYIG